MDCLPVGLVLFLYPKIPLSFLLPLFFILPHLLKPNICHQSQAFIHLTLLSFYPVYFSSDSKNGLFLFLYLFISLSGLQGGGGWNGWWGQAVFLGLQRLDEGFHELAQRNGNNHICFFFCYLSCLRLMAFAPSSALSLFSHQAFRLWQS